VQKAWCQERVSGVSYTSPPTSTSWQRLLKITSLCAHAHAPKFRKNPGKFPFVLFMAQWMHGMRTMNFPYGRCRKLSSKSGLACLQTISLPSAWWADASEGRWSVFERCKQLRLFQIKARAFSQIRAFGMQSEISDDPRSRSPRGSLSAATLELPGPGEGRIQHEWPPRTSADCVVCPNALPVAAPAA
jgi:hypothetical protein